MRSRLKNKLMVSGRSPESSTGVDLFWFFRDKTGKLWLEQTAWASCSIQEHLPVCMDVSVPRAFHMKSLAFAGIPFSSDSVVIK